MLALGLFCFYKFILYLQCFEHSSHEVFTASLMLNFRKIVWKTKRQCSHHLTCLKSLLYLISNLFFLYPKPIMSFSVMVQSKPASLISCSVWKQYDGFDLKSPAQMSNYKFMNTFHCKHLQVSSVILNTPSVHHCWGCTGSTVSLR